MNRLAGWVLVSVVLTSCSAAPIRASGEDGGRGPDSTQVVSGQSIMSPADRVAAVRTGARGSTSRLPGGSAAGALSPGTSASVDALRGLRPARDFAGTYGLSGELTYSVLGVDRRFAPPKTGRSTWQDGQATAFFRAQTDYGALGFLLGFVDESALQVARVLVIVPASRDSSKPGETFFDFPLTTYWSWRSAAVGEVFHTESADGRWNCELVWADAQTLRFTVRPTAGYESTNGLRSGAVELRFTPGARPWSEWTLSLDADLNRGRLTGSMSARRSG